GRAIEIQTSTPGYAVQVYGAANIDLSLPYGNSTPLAGRGWQGPIGATAFVGERERIGLDARQPFRYYLIWITTLPAHMQSASITDLTLFR
ncbi:MAG: hypothetical protein ACHP93_03825, partial [Solirubrobacterales bacterium]